MISCLCIGVVCFVLGFFVLGPLMFPKKKMEPCRCKAPREILQVYEDDLGQSELLIWIPEEGPPRKVMGLRHTYKAKCCQCGRIHLDIGTFRPPEEKTFS